MVKRIGAPSCADAAKATPENAHDKSKDRSEKPIELSFMSETTPVNTPGRRG
ncbi:hypothetical protein [Albidovulum salinarum]|uniref:hypothetical protein n=1 Tax=Albidovulum salinarum TaxID=2984153 RepID=UPI0021E0D354|nr:hypothetical protein [Defluviimonas sp. WL0024]